MVIKQIPYNGSSKKYYVNIGGILYTCYTHPFNLASNFVVIGDGGKDSIIITDTILGQKILLACKSI